MHLSGNFFMPKPRKSNSILAFLHAVMGPISELATALGLTVTETEEILRYQFVRGAMRRLGKARDRRITFSDVAVVTGLDRKQVTRLLALTEPKFPDDGASSHRAARVLSAWHEDVDYRGADGNPRILKMDGPLGFAALVGRYASDVPPRAVLDDLCFRNAAVVTPSNDVRALSNTLLSMPRDPALLDSAGRQLAHLLRALTHNLSSDGESDPMFVRDIAIDKLTSEELSIARRDARSLLEPALDSVLLTKRTEEATAAKPRHGNRTLRAIVCISTVDELTLDPSKRPRQHRKRRDATEPNSSDANPAVRKRSSRKRK